MGPKDNSLNELDRTISVLEDLFLSASDDEITKRGTGLGDLGADVREMIDKHLSIGHRTIKRRSTSLTKVEMKDTFDYALLKRLVAARSDISPRLRSVFSGGKIPSKDELKYLSKELNRLGLPSRSKSSKKKK